MRAFTVLTIAVAASSTLATQQAPAAGNQQGAAPAAASAPAPKRDITGVWMMRNPPGSNRGYTNFTFTDPKLDPPALTAWGEARFKEAKDSNGGNYRLDETNDPVLTKCYPPGVPRVYFHPYPFEVVHTPKVTLLVYEYDHTLRRVYTDGRKLVPDQLDPSGWVTPSANGRAMTSSWKPSASTTGHGSIAWDTRTASSGR